MKSINLFIVRPKNFVSTDCFEAFHIEKGNDFPIHAQLIERAALRLDMDAKDLVVNVIHDLKVTDIDEVYVDFDSEGDGWCLDSDLKSEFKKLRSRGWIYKQNKSSDTDVLYEGRNLGADIYSSIKQSYLIN